MKGSVHLVSTAHTMNRLVACKPPEVFSVVKTCQLWYNSVLITCSTLSYASVLQSMLHLALLGLQQMWEDMGVRWEWTWYSQTAHAFTQPQLVGAAASAVSLLCCAVM